VRRAESARQVRFLAAGASCGRARGDVAVQGCGVEADPLDVVLAEELLDTGFELRIVVEGVVAKLDGVAMRGRQRPDELGQRIQCVAGLCESRRPGAVVRRRDVYSNGVRGCNVHLDAKCVTVRESPRGAAVFAQMGEASVPRNLLMCRSTESGASSGRK